MGTLIKPAILLGAVYSFLKFVVPNIPGSAPLPASLIFLYLMLVMGGIVIFYTMSGESKDAFWGPIQRFLTGENLGALQAARYAWIWKIIMGEYDGAHQSPRTWE